MNQEITFKDKAVILASAGVMALTSACGIELPASRNITDKNKCLTETTIQTPGCRLPLNQGKTTLIRVPERSERAKFRVETKQLDQLEISENARLNQFKDELFESYQEMFKILRQMNPSEVASLAEFCKTSPLDLKNMAKRIVLIEKIGGPLTSDVNGKPMPEVQEAAEMVCSFSNESVDMFFSPRRYPDKDSYNEIQSHFESNQKDRILQQPLNR